MSRPFSIPLTCWSARHGMHQEPIISSGGATMGDCDRNPAREEGPVLPTQAAAENREARASPQVPRREAVGQPSTSPSHYKIAAQHSSILFRSTPNRTADQIHSTRDPSTPIRQQCLWCAP